MSSAIVKLLSGLVGAILMGAFVLGLSHSISTGFAGFWGGLPFLVIVLVVLAMMLYDVWEECVREFLRQK